MKRIIMISLVFLFMVLLVSCDLIKPKEESPVKTNGDEKTPTAVVDPTIVVPSESKEPTVVDPTVTPVITPTPTIVPVVYHVKFYDYDGELFLDVEVNEHEGAIIDANPEKDGYSFDGWDKDFSDITEDLDVYPIFSIETYSIDYNLGDNRVWGYANKQEYVKAFIKDFYEFLGLDTDLDEFIYGSDGKYTGLWKDYIGGSVGQDNRLLYNNDIDETNDKYFFNSSYKDKWYSLSSYVKNYICANNHRFGSGGDYTYAALDFYRYITDDPYQYIDIYGGNKVFYGFPDIEVSYETTYQISEEDLVLSEPLSSDFEGWFLEDGTKIEKIAAGMTGNLNLVAHWKEVPVYTITFDVVKGDSISPLQVEFRQNIDLPSLTFEGFRFTGWYYNGSRLPDSFSYIYEKDITVTAGWVDIVNVKLEDLIYSGTPVTYRNSSERVQIPTVYVQKERQFRGVWVSSMVGNFSPSTNKTTMQRNLTDLLDTMDALNLNAIVFHLRTHNNAYYKTKLTTIASNYGTYSTFEAWDYLPWFISECHKRGIEFHAWLNPYRVVSSGASSLESTANKFASFPNNPASKTENLLMNSSGGVIMDPAVPAVRDFIVNVCMEIIANYDVDAIHFDDYFYIEGIDDSASRAKYNTNNLSTDDFRREQVNLFIKQLHNRMSNYNKDHNRYVQLGISPTGIYRNGNGSVDSGSNTSGYAHYGSPLYADTLKWARENWIDYLLPQSYWGFSHKTAGYADVMDWWNLAFEGLTCNLYSGIGIYMNNNDGKNYSWGTEPYEVSNQILYTTKLDNVKGVCFYSYSQLKSAYNSSSEKAHLGTLRLIEEYWKTKIPTPLTMADNN